MVPVAGPSIVRLAPVLKLPLVQERVSVTARVCDPDIVPPEIKRPATVTSVVRVTVPPEMVTISPAPGIIPQLHFIGSFQFPEPPFHVQIAADSGKESIRHKKVWMYCDCIGSI
jgi:hypothetical protein